jgi:hypothetical protein
MNLSKGHVRPTMKIPDISKRTFQNEFNDLSQSAALKLFIFLSIRLNIMQISPFTAGNPVCAISIRPEILQCPVLQRHPYP